MFSTFSWLNITSYNHLSSSNSSSSNKSNNTVTTNEDSPTALLWDIRWFAILSAPLLFGTIILPLVIGPVLRSICHSYIRARPYWRVALSSLGLCIWVYSYVGILPFSGIMAIMLDGCLLGLVIRTALLAGRPLRHPYLWTLWTLLVTGLFVFDVMGPGPLTLGWIGWLIGYAKTFYRRYRRYQARRMAETRSH